MLQECKVISMFRNVIAPVQAWLLSQGRCVGCGANIEDGKQEKHAHGVKIICPKCGRIFIKDSGTGKYRRALFEEV